MTVRRKWRPPLALLVTALVAVVLVLPILAMGAVVAFSRTPGELLTSVQDNWVKVTIAVAFMAAISVVTGYIFWRGLSRPLRDLSYKADTAVQDSSGFVTDASYGTREVAQLAQNFSILVERLQARSTYLESLSAHLAHEIRSPLTSIRGAAELIRDDGSGMSDEQRLRFLENILDDTRRLDSLTDRLRELAHADLAPQGGTVSINDAVSDLRDDYSDLEITVEAPGTLSLPLSRGDASIVFGHLAGNAIAHKATRLLITGQSANDIEVSNNGEPIAKNYAGKLFTPFFTTRREDGGTGLGLAIVASIISAAGGTVSLQSRDPVAFHIEFGN